AEIRAWDVELGTLLDTLAGRGLADSTIVVLIADHGEEFQEHGRLKHRIHLYDELLHVPLVIAGPGVRPGRVAEQAQGIDLFPTLAALLGTAPPRGLSGSRSRRRSRRAPRPRSARRPSRAGSPPASTAWWCARRGTGSTPGCRSRRRPRSPAPGSRRSSGTGASGQRAGGSAPRS